MAKTKRKRYQRYNRRGHWPSYWSVEEVNVSYGGGDYELASHYCVMEISESEPTTARILSPIYIDESDAIAWADVNASKHK